MAVTRGLVIKHNVEREQKLPVAASIRVYPGVLYVRNTSGDMVELVNTSNFKGAALCIEKDVVDNSSGSAGDKDATFMTKGRCVVVLDSAPADIDLEKVVYAPSSANGDRVSLTAGNGVKVGKITRVQDVVDPAGRSNVVEIEIGGGVL